MVDLPAGDLVAHVLGTMMGWDALGRDRVTDCSSPMRDATWEAMQRAFAGGAGSRLGEADRPCGVKRCWPRRSPAK